MRIQCPQCARRLVLKEAHAGRVVTCPACQQQITIPVIQPTQGSQPPRVVGPPPPDRQIPIEDNSGSVQNVRQMPGSSRWTTARKIELAALLATTLLFCACPMSVVTVTAVNPNQGMDILANEWAMIGVVLIFLSAPIIVIWAGIFLFRILRNPGATHEYSDLDDDDSGSRQPRRRRSGG